MAKKFRSVIVDTLTAIQTNQYMGLLEKGKIPTIHTWKDFGVELYEMVSYAQSLGCEVVLILGREGSGKSYGIKSLEPKATMWLHCDNKPITFKGGRQNYNEESKNFFVPETYDKVKEYIKIAYDNKQDGPFIVFLLGHIADLKTTDDEGKETTRQGLKVLGNLATKQNVEGKVAYCYFTVIKMEGEKPTFWLRTQTNGFNSARSPEEMHEEIFIPNNFQTIVEAILNY